MSKLKRILLIIIIVPLVLMVVIMFGAAPFGRRYVNEHGEELIGRRVQIEGFTFNYLSGNASLNDMTIYEKNGDSVFAQIEDLDLNISMLDLLKGNIVLESLDIEDARVYVVQRGTSFNFDDMIAFFASDEEASEYKIGSVELDDCDIIYTDMTEPSVPFSYTIKDLEVDIDDFTTTGDNHIEANAELGEDGEAKVVYDGSITNFDNAKISLQLEDIDLVALSPMFIQMFGREITSGSLEMQSEIDIADRRISATNHILIDEPKVQKVKGLSFKPEYRRIPLKTCLYFLTDKNGKCDLDLPITGSLDDPRFSYRRVLMKAFGNVITKIATSPFKHKSDVDEDEEEEEPEDE